MYIKDNIKYTRCLNLEIENSHIIIIDLENGGQVKKRIINIYRSFNPSGETAKELFIRQLNIICGAFNVNTVLLGDLNLDHRKKQMDNIRKSVLIQSKSTTQ